MGGWEFNLNLNIPQPKHASNFVPSVNADLVYKAKLLVSWIFISVNDRLLPLQSVSVCVNPAMIRVKGRRCLSSPLSDIKTQDISSYLCHLHTQPLLPIQLIHYMKYSFLQVFFPLNVSSRWLLKCMSWTLLFLDVNRSSCISGRSQRKVDLQRHLLLIYKRYFCFHRLGFIHETCITVNTEIFISTTLI